MAKLGRNMPRKQRSDKGKPRGSYKDRWRAQGERSKLAQMAKASSVSSALFGVAGSAAKLSGEFPFLEPASWAGMLLGSLAAGFLLGIAVMLLVFRRGA